MSQRQHPPRSKKTDDGPASNAQPQESIWEWIVAGIGLVLVAATLATLLYEGLQPKTLPLVTVRLAQVQSSNSQYLVLFEAINEGGTGAANVTIRGELSDATGPIEDSETVINFVPAGSVQLGGLYFKHDPTQTQLELRAIGFESP